MWFLLLPIKIVLLPIIAALGLGRLFLTFIVAIAGSVLTLISGIFGILIFILIFTGWLSLKEIIGYFFFAFVISPYGLPLLAEWLLDRLGDLNDAIIDFVRYS